MGPGEIIEIVAALKAAGATHFKCRDFAVRFTRAGSTKVVSAKPPVPAPHVTQADLHSPENTKRAEDLITKLKLSPEELIDSIFPDGAGGG